VIHFFQAADVVQFNIQGLSPKSVEAVV